MTLHIERVADDQKRKPTSEELAALLVHLMDLGQRFLKGALNPAGTLELLQQVQEGFVICASDKKIEKPSLRLVVSGVPIPAAPEIVVKNCFKIKSEGGVFADSGRDKDFDLCLPKTFPAVKAGSASSFELDQVLSFHEIVAAHLNLTGVSEKELEKALIAQGKTWSLLQIEALCVQCDKGENPLQLRTDGCATIFFIEVDGEVFAVHVYRRADGWYVYVCRFGYAYRWTVGRRVSFRN